MMFNFSESALLRDTLTVLLREDGSLLQMLVRSLSLGEVLEEGVSTGGSLLPPEGGRAVGGGPVPRAAHDCWSH